MIAADHAAHPSTAPLGAPRAPDASRAAGWPRARAATVAGQPLATARARANALRRVVDVLVLSATLAILLDAWLLKGLLVPMIVSSGSMTPVVLGPHRAWRCAECDRAFACSAEALPESGTAICPNCGAANAAGQGVDRRGERVLVDRSAFLWRAPRRWETVVFRSPQEPTMLCVKRVVGLPGETVEFDDGDVLIDGRRARKSLAEARQMAVSVYDMPERDDRWEADAGGNWRIDGGHAVHRATEAAARDDAQYGAETPRIDWIAYCHRRRLAPSAPLGDGPITDESPCDQNESRALNPAADIALDCRLSAHGNGTVLLRATARRDRFTVRLDVTSGAGELEHNGVSIATIATSTNPLRSPSRAELVLADRRVQFALDGYVLAACDYRPAMIAAADATAPVAIGAQGATVDVCELRILRDVHYTAERSAKYRLGPDEYFLLGDNSAHAVDSRVWSPGAPVTRSLLLGKALVW